MKKLENLIVKVDPEVVRHAAENWIPAGGDRVRVRGNPKLTGVYRVKSASRRTQIITLWVPGGDDIDGDLEFETVPVPWDSVEPA